jgi:hypothetical protein
MDIDQQIQELIANAPSDGKTPTLVRAIAPALKDIAGRLNQLEYYVVKTSDDAWVTTTLRKRKNPSVEKKVVYAYPTLADARRSSIHPEHADVLATVIPVTHILFQMLAMKTVNSTVFFEQPGQASPAIEVSKQQLVDAVQAAYRRQKPSQNKGSSLA